jgi:hypothetical protein
MLAYEYDYPLLGIFWTMLIVFLWIAWIMLLFRVFADIFRNHKMRGVSKGIWSIFVIIAPFVGVLLYLIVHGGSMARRDMEVARANEEAFRAYVRDAAGSDGVSTELSRLALLKDQGVLSESEFQQQKTKALSH